MKNHLMNSSGATDIVKLPTYEKIASMWKSDYIAAPREILYLALDNVLYDTNQVGEWAMNNLTKIKKNLMSWMDV